MKNHLNENIRALRKSLDLTQEEFASQLKIKRSLVGAYEEGRAEPRLELLCKMADLGGISVEELLHAPEAKAGFKKIKKNVLVKNISTLTKSSARHVDISPHENKNNIELVPVKAAAGYLNGYADPEFVHELPRFSLPMLNHGTYRAFEISGDSMLPLESGTIVVGEFIDHVSGIRNGKTYVLVTRSEGVVYKRVFNYTDENGKLFLVSDNRQYAPYQIDATDVIEIWSAKAYISLNFPE
ncbi:MAG: helix-turn-helix domain-containing protein [Cyclobacteriaceae bacterium]|jgi:transcriptional regulator with XRE-family HTH domain